MQKNSSLAKWGAAVLLLSSLTSCEDILEQYFPRPTPTIPTFPNPNLDITFYALSGGTQLDAYSTKDPTTRTGAVSITGLASGERILAIDFRPATGQLYGVSSASRIYIINHTTGVVQPIGSGPFSAGAGPFTPAIVGNLVGFDFNPTVDRIRLVTSTGQNLRLNPETGAVAATDGSISGAAATITGAAYTNNVAGASTTVLYDLDPATDQLYRQEPPNEGTLVPVGALNLNITGDGGFDIDAKTGTALGLYVVSGRPTLFSVDLSTGAARPLVQYAPNTAYSGLAIPTQPVAYAAANVCAETGICSNKLLIFNPTNPTAFVNKPITGLRSSEILQGLDFRPANGQLYAITTGNNLYTISPATGVATFVARIGLLLPGGPLGVDFNPVTDNLRIVSIAPGRNMRIEPINGGSNEETPLNPGLSLVAAAAHNNNFAGTTSTSLYVIDYGTNKLYLQNIPSAGTLTEIGSLGTNVDGDIHFDIGGLSNTAYLLYTPSGQFIPPPGTSIKPGPNMLYTVNLSTGRATLISEFDFSSVSDRADYQLRGFTVGLGF